MDRLYCPAVGCSYWTYHEPSLAAHRDAEIAQTTTEALIGELLNRLRGSAHASAALEWLVDITEATTLKETRAHSDQRLRAAAGPRDHGV
jgi:hypothetical protein